MSKSNNFFTSFITFIISLVIVGGVVLCITSAEHDDIRSELYDELIKYEVPIKSVSIFSTAEKANGIKYDDFVGFKIEFQEPLDGEKFIYRESNYYMGTGQLFVLCNKPEDYVSKYALTLFRRDKQKFNNGELELLILCGSVTLRDR